MLDIWEEIWSSLQKNKLRTFLTGFSVAWGIFMLILLLGSGNGLKNGVKKQFGDRAKNSMVVWPGRTSLPWNGLQKGRKVKFGNQSLRYLKQQHPEISKITPTFSLWNTTISYGKEYTNNSTTGVSPDFKEIRNIEVKPGNGRFVNETDIRDRRKVVILHERTAELLFKNEREKALGKYVKINNLAFQVVGIYSDENLSRTPSVFMPLTAAQLLRPDTWGYGSFEFTVDGIKSKEEGSAFEQSVRKTLGQALSYNPQDQRAVWVWNVLENYMQTMGIFNGISFFIWIIGIGTLIAGIVGVSNIMLITVKERTREFGIRKALGASPVSILKLVVVESVLITLFFGYIGMVLGIGVTEGVAWILNQNPVGEGGFAVFTNPTVELPIAVAATAVLVLAGVLAGYFPARKAVKIRPIGALRNE